LNHYSILYSNLDIPAGRDGGRASAALHLGRDAHGEEWKGYAIPTLATAILANLPGIILWITFFTGFRLFSVEGLIQRLGFVIVIDLDLLCCREIVATGVS